MGITSSGRELPSAVARLRASCEGSKLRRFCKDERKWNRMRDMAYIASARKRLTLCIVMRAVGEDDIMMIGSVLPIFRESE